MLALFARLCCYSLALAGVIYVNVWYQGVFLFLASLLLAGLSVIAIGFLEVRNVLLRENSLARVAREVVLIVFAVGMISAVGPFGRYSTKLVQESHLQAFESRLDRQRLIAAYTIDASGFAGSSYFSLIVFDRTGEIQRPPEQRSETWWAAALQADGVLTGGCAKQMTAMEIKPYFYAVSIAC